MSFDNGILLCGHSFHRFFVKLGYAFLDMYVLRSIAFLHMHFWHYIYAWGSAQLFYQRIGKQRALQLIARLEKVQMVAGVHQLEAEPVARGTLAAGHSI